MDLATCVNNGVAPLVLPWTDVQVTPDLGSGVNRGVAVEVGNPPQFFSANVEAYYENSFFTAASICNNNPDNYTCIADYGGIYIPGPNAQVTNSLANWNGSDTEDVHLQDAAYVFYNDIWNIGGHTIPGMPFFTSLWLSDRSSLRSTLSLGRNSSTLEHFLKEKIAPIKSWSMWPGDRHLDNKIDGNVIIGGYDEDRADGPFTAYPMSTAHGDVLAGRLWVDVTGFSWQSPSNTTSLLPNGTNSYVGLIDPTWTYLGMPDTVRANFLQATGGTANVTNNLTYWSWNNGLPEGSLTVSLSNGLDVIIPSADLFTTSITRNDNGVLEGTTSGAYYSWTYTSSDAPNNFVLGLPWLEQVLLVMDFDANTYHVANAKKTFYGNPTNIKTLCQSTATPSPTPPPPPPPGSGSSVNVGAIAGGVGGGVGALILAVIAFCLYRRRKSKKAADTDTHPEIASPPMAKTYYPPADLGHAGSPGSPPPQYPTVHEAYTPQNPGSTAGWGGATDATGGWRPASEMYAYEPGKHEVQQNVQPLNTTYELDNSRR